MEFPAVSFEPEHSPTSATQRERIAQKLITIDAMRAAGDIEGMLAHIADDVVCFPPTTWGHAFFPATLRGKAALREALRQRHIHYIFQPSQIRRVLIDGDRVIVHRTSTSLPRGGGPGLTCDVIDLVRFRDELVVEFNEFPDGSARSAVNYFPR